MSGERELEPLDQRIQLMMSKSEVAAIDDWSWGQRIRSRAEAIRQLIAAGLESTASAPPEPEPAPSKKPRKRS